MSYILIIIALGAGTSNVPAIYSVTFKNKDSCENAQRFLYESVKNFYYMQLTAYCQEDK